MTGIEQQVFESYFATQARFHVVFDSNWTPTIEPMARITATFSVSLPLEMAATLEQVRREEHRTRSELVREALRQYFWASEGKVRPL